MQQLLPIHWPEALSVYPVMLLAVIVIARLLPVPGAYQPLTLFRFFVRQLALKVNPDPNRAVGQLYISGSLALVVGWLTPLLLVTSLYQFSDLPLLLDALLLYFSFDWRQQQLAFLQLHQMLAHRQLSLAKEHAKSLLCRKTDNLSEMGLSKALLEAMVLRAARDFIGVACAFLLAGGIGALAYRLLLDIQQQWNTKRSLFRHFGQPAAILSAFVTALPKIISVALLAMQGGLRKCIRQCRAPRLNISRLSYWLICCASVTLNRNLGGPLYYNRTKLQRSKIQQQAEPTPSDISKLYKRLQFSHVFAALILLTFIVIHWLWQALK